MATISKIAEVLGISKSTVSRALRGLPSVSPETIAAVREAAERMDYVPSVAASGLSTGRQHAIGVVVPSLNRWFYTSVLSGVDRALAELGYDIVLFDLDRGHSSSDSTRLFVRSLLRRRVDALIVISTKFEEEELAEFALLDIPMIAVGPPAPGFRTIGVDDVAIMTTATEHVTSLGHRAIGFVGGYDPESLIVASAEAREHTFLRVAEAAGAVVDPAWILAGGYRGDIARRAVGELLAQDSRPTAFVCASDEMAIGAMFAIQAAGLSVPGDISVIGIDGHEQAENYDLTTCRQDAQAQGALAAHRIVAEVEGAARQETFPPSEYALVVRGSTGAPPRHP